MNPQEANEVGQMLGLIISILLIGGAFLVAKNVIKTLLFPFYAALRFLFTRRRD